MFSQYKKIRKYVDLAGKILLISHRSPDADTLGAALALRKVLLSKGKGVEVACIDKPRKTYSFLENVSEFVLDFNIEDYDLVIVLDAGASYMTDFHLRYPNLFDGSVPIINIDHHASNDNFGTVNVVDPKAASTTYILYKMFLDWGVEIDEEIATALLSGIYGDTGSFMHANTSGDVLQVAADLMAYGAQIAEITKALFNTTDIKTLKLWGKVLEKSSVTDDDVVMSVIRDSEYAEYDAAPNNLSGVIDYLNMVPETKFAVLLHEDRQGNVKGSFRTRVDDIDLSRIAAVFGGGGHPKASGFSIRGKLKQELKYSIISDEDKKTLDF